MYVCVHTKYKRALDPQSIQILMKIYIQIKQKSYYIYNFMLMAARLNDQRSAATIISQPQKVGTHKCDKLEISQTISG